MKNEETSDGRPFVVTSRIPIQGGIGEKKSSLSSIGVGQALAALAAIFGPVYALGLLVLQAQLSSSYNFDASTAWFAATLISKPMVAVQGGLAVLPLTLLFTFVVLSAGTLAAFGDSDAVNNWTPSSSRVRNFFLQQMVRILLGAILATSYIIVFVILAVAGAIPRTLIPDRRVLLFPSSWPTILSSLEVGDWWLVYLWITAIWLTGLCGLLYSLYVLQFSWQFSQAWKGWPLRRWTTPLMRKSRTPSWTTLLLIWGLIYLLALPPAYGFAAAQAPPIPTVTLEMNDGNIQGGLVAHVDGHWYVATRGAVLAIHDDAVSTEKGTGVRISPAP